MKNKMVKLAEGLSVFALVLMFGGAIACGTEELTITLGAILLGAGGLLSMLTNVLLLQIIRK